MALTDSGFWNPDEQYDLDPATGQYTKKPPLGMPQPTGVPAPQLQAGYTGQLPTGYSQGEVNEWLARNPGDTHRVMSALNDRGSAPAQSPTQQWNAQPAAGNAQRDQLFQLLMSRAQQGTAVNRNDPNIRAQVDPVVAQQERSSRNYLSDLAERAGPLANLTGERRLASERSGQAAGAFESEIIGRQIMARREEVMQSLQLATQYGLAEKANELQRELAQLNAQLQREGFGLQREGMNQGNEQFLRQLALNEWMAGDASDRAWAGFGG